VRNHFIFVYFHPIFESKSAPTFSSYILNFFWKDCRTACQRNIPTMGNTSFALKYNKYHKFFFNVQNLQMILCLFKSVGLAKK